MPKRGWSLTDAQLERRKQNPAARKATAKRGKSDPLPVDQQWNKRTGAKTRDERQRRGVRQQAMSRPSPARIRERSSGSGVPHTGGAAGYSRDTYSKPDLASLEPGKLLAHQARGTRHIQTPEGRGGYDHSGEAWRGSSHLTPQRQTPGSHLRDAGRTASRRQQSTQAAYRAADASMFNSTVTPKAERVENKKPRSRMSPDQNVFW